MFRADREAKVRVNITGGPLAYHYQFEEIYIHYGLDDGHGSEHRINNYAFPAEVSSIHSIKMLQKNDPTTWLYELITVNYTVYPIKLSIKSARWVEYRN